MLELEPVKCMSHYTCMFIMDIHYAGSAILVASKLHKNRGHVALLGSPVVVTYVVVRICKP